MVPPKKTVEEMYQKKTQVEHILLRPDTYIGSSEAVPQVMWVLEKGRFVQKTLSLVPGLFKIFDEILVNAADNKMKDTKMTTIKVDVSRKTGRITIFNDGEGIPVTVHKTYKIYVPELIFGHLLTSSNYDDAEKKMTGGRNGYGAKLCNIFSTEFIVESADRKKQLHFFQKYTKNMSNKTEPDVVKSTCDDFTRISFVPDFAKFGMKGLDEDHFLLFQKRAYDIAGCLKGVEVYFNGEKIPISGFRNYVSMYFTGVDDFESKAAFFEDEKNTRWQVCCTLSEGQFQQVSFVNRINTYKGGTHITHVTDKIVHEIIEGLRKKKKGSEIKPLHVKPHIFIFVNCLIENPAFDSQTKENMTLRQTSFGSDFVMSKKFSKEVLALPIMESALSWVNFKEQLRLKKTDGQKSSRLSGIPKLDDANNAGTKFGKHCTLILTEGDSAKSLAVAGLSVIGRNNYGVFPLRGKLLNVREASPKQIMDNEEVKSLKKIIGLQQGREYDGVDSLRYGHIMMMTDQDHDGSHIKGLIINLIDHFWPSLLRIEGFLLEFITPIVKCTRRKEEIVFYTIPEYEEWKRQTEGQTGWTVKYYKGLGTSTSADAKKYFSELGKNRKYFESIDDGGRELVDMAFNKKRADERKIWLSTLTKDIFIDHRDEMITYDNFINRELILFSNADNMRSIPSLVDGLKVGQRKILFSCFKKNLTKEMKVAQLIGYVAENSAYHHGEQSLASTIVTLAQNFVGSNNVNLLAPNGQFGTRIQGGSDSASPRYIFTVLEKITRLIFPADDDPVLDYLDEDAQSIEPEYYVPVVPFVLFNGSDGIGTGWSTKIPNHHPIEVLDVVAALVDGREPPEELLPWYAGFVGSISKIGENRFQTTGVFTKDPKKRDLYTITELPIGTWTQPYKEYLEKLMVGDNKTPAIVKRYKEHHSEKSVSFEITLHEDGLQYVHDGGFEALFKLRTILNTTNMVLFDQNGKLKKYQGTLEIIREFFDVRLAFYHKRKAWAVASLEREVAVMDNKARFVLEIVEGRLTIVKKKKNTIEQELRRKGFRAEQKKAEDDDGAFDYLLSMPLVSLTSEKAEKLVSERDKKRAELELLLKTTERDLWRKDLATLREGLISAGIADPAISKRHGKGENPKTRKLSVSERLKKMISGEDRGCEYASND
eukprot:GHVN01087387.1.p1 GENE.GHVN01087387.1~~GHVN01087387.1.p1  ORF type:complete len:1160 (+),score=123.64 GHVN01087387.1:2-3481(+)